MPAKGRYNKCSTFTCFTFKLCSNFLLGNVDVQMSGWSEIRRTEKDDWKSITEEFGEQSVMIYSTTWMPALSATVLDLGWSHSGS